MLASDAVLFKKLRQRMTQDSPYFKNNTAVDGQTFNQSALDPARSVLIKACAGSGKTWLLTSRIVRLLLAGVPSHQILAITFTNKAAQEMRNRVGDVLRELADGTDDAVLGQLTMRGLSLDAAHEALPRARRLYDEVLGAVQPLPIYTFHAWFARLLRAAPTGLAEVGRLRDATLSEDVASLQQEAWNDFYELFQTDEVLRAHYLSLVRRLGQHSTQVILDNALSSATEWRLFETSCAEQGIDVLANLAADYQNDLGVSVDATADELLSVWQQGFFANRAFETWLKVWQCAPSKPTQEKIRLLETVFDMSDAREQFAYIQPYLAKGTGTWKGNLFTASSAQKAIAIFGISESEFEAINEQMAQATAKYYAMEKDAAAFALHVDIVPCVQALLRVYEAVKERSGTFDFNDVEYHCLSLLSDERTAAYVQIQLDARYQHLLFDEFQDTSPLQWQVIHGWLAAYGADENRPKVFVVGDLKQSIYRFRKADARVFAAAEHLLTTQYQADVLETHLTRRNSIAVVEWVNRVFESENSQLMGFKTQQTTSKVAGHVACLQAEFTSSEETEDSEEKSPRDWLREPQHTIEATEHDGEAAQLAAVVGSLVGRYELANEDGSTRLTEFKDIMVLLQNRVHLAVYERQLREARIPFISTRKGGLLDTLEALDIMALVAWLMDAHDDLSLLHVLRSPLGGVDEAFVQLLVGRRREWAELGRSVSLWCVGLSDESIPRRALWERLSSWQERAPNMTPHEVMDMIYHEADIFQCYASVTPAWLNEQVQANLRAFLHMALALNAGRYPSLYRYWQALKTWQQQSKNAPSEATPIEATNAVQVMTAHGAKGLEAPIVILIDVKETSERERAYHWLIDWPIDALRPAHVSLVASEAYRGQWRQVRWQDNETRAAIEKWNLLYVAMTRAQQTLIVSSAQKEKKTKKDTESGKRTLYEYLHDSAKMLDEAYRFDLPIMEGAEFLADSPSSPTSSHINRYIQMMSSDELVIAAQPINEEQPAAQLGILWHAVMEHTTDNWQAPRLSVADVMQKYRVPFDNAHVVVQWMENVCAQPELQVWLNPVYFDEAHNETMIVDATGTVKRIDRWVRRGIDITVIDYKSDWREEDLPLYREQVQSYQTLLSQMYPQHDVSGVLIRADGRWLRV
ncbi:hypothetical protein GCM10009007_18050 [Formosimonas limnophila]|uniref:DNA 3'-5' helicase n=1 Tax=Formosimonas limnophila TaxID=1384487 RepID=A0A8J3CLP2_9BURK|nr:UvrD-helicase domain-containing protein [Formosimonas limnophila]GHA77537.1 hypothetical protein GCM10009007_18050 [Formosimonas limnophila]